MEITKGRPHLDRRTGTGGMVRLQNLQATFLERFGAVVGTTIGLRRSIVFHGLEKFDGLDEDVDVLAAEVGFAAQHRFAVQFLVDGNLNGQLKLQESVFFSTTRAKRKTNRFLLRQRDSDLLRRKSEICDRSVPRTTQHFWPVVTPVENVKTR